MKYTEIWNENLASSDKKLGWVMVVSSSTRVVSIRVHKNGSMTTKSISLTCTQLNTCEVSYRGESTVYYTDKSTQNLTLSAIIREDSWVT